MKQQLTEKGKKCIRQQKKYGRNWEEERNGEMV